MGAGVRDIPPLRRLRAGERLGIVADDELARVAVEHKRTLNTTGLVAGRVVAHAHAPERARLLAHRNLVGRIALGGKLPDELFGIALAARREHLNVEALAVRGGALLRRLFLGLLGLGPGGGRRRGFGGLGLGRGLRLHGLASLVGKVGSGGGLLRGGAPSQGCDRFGPTAILRSLDKMPHACLDGGTLLNLWLTPAVVQGEEGGHRLSAFLKAFLDMDIFHIQFNVVGQDILRCAQERPEEYRSLLVRVAGYSAYFVELSREVQDDILSRTVNTL